MHVAALRHESRIFDVADDLELVHAVACPGGAHDVLFDHHAAHIVGAVRKAQLPDLPALRDPRRLQVVKIVEDDSRNRERAQVVDARRLPARQLGMVGLIAPRDKGGESTGLILERTKPQQMLHAFLVGLDRAVHHRGCRPQTGAMRVPHHVEPLVGRRFAVAVQQSPHAIDQNLSTTAGDAVEARRYEAVDDLRNRKLRQTRQVNNFRGR